ncbi:unnamed protein product [Adineta ricciae]|uniref:DUF4832 domain-containing protein n=1 Tax=Adineta ricciae TaxID=249248 RepID=A0A814D6U5_ADIRI|nr:unnamed protein product [Adineta ricciae]CAF1399115.1 unnamed protein product [Adineta ricciae]
MNHQMFILLYVFMINSWYNALAAEPPNATKTFASTQTLFANPERGWITHRFSDDVYDVDSLRSSAEKVSLLLIKIDISAYRNSSHIGQSKLNEIRSVLATCRQQGLKAIMRSAYSWDLVLAPEPKSLETVKGHIMDMKPIYYEYEDIIVAVEMGMFGPWGEMHSSYYSTVNTGLFYPIKTSALREVHATYMSALPTARSVILRTPYYIRQVFNSNTPLSPAEAYSSNPKARTGYHNDAYLSSSTDSGTFDYGWSRAQELAYVGQMTRYTFFGGETYGTPNGPYNKAQNALVESKQQHMTYLNRDYDPPIYNAWGTTVKQEFTRKLGYCFQLQSLSHSKEVAPGGLFSFSLKLRNIGFAAMHLTRPVKLTLDNGKTGSTRVTYNATLSVDPRTWTPEANVISIDRKLRIPANIKQGVWRLLLALPDGSTRLQSDVRYTVRLANENIWNADGTHLLANDISITASAPGTRTNETVFREITA